MIIKKEYEIEKNSLYLNEFYDNGFSIKNLVSPLEIIRIYTEKTSFKTNETAIFNFQAVEIIIKDSINIEYKNIENDSFSCFINNSEKHILEEGNVLNVIFEIPGDYEILVFDSKNRMGKITITIEEDI